MLLQRRVLVGGCFAGQDFLRQKTRQRRRFEDTPGKAHAAQQGSHILGMGEVIALEQRQIGRVARAQPDLAARFAFEQIGLHRDAVDLRRLLLGLAADERHEVELHFGPAIAVEVEKAAAFDDVRGQQPFAEQHPFEEMAQPFRALFVAVKPDRVLEPAPDRRRDMVLEIGADLGRIGAHGDAVRLEMRGGSNAR